MKCWYSDACMYVYNLTIAVVLQTKRDVISPRIRSTLSCFLKHWDVIFCEPADTHTLLSQWK